MITNSDAYKCYYVTDIYWYYNSKNYALALQNIEITSSTNSTLISLGYSGRNSTSSSAACKWYLVFLDGSGRDIVLSFSSVDSINVYGIK